MGAFCIFGRFFQKSFAFIRRLKKSPVLSREKGRYRHLSTRKEVRTWNLIAWNFRSNVSFKVSVNGCCTTKRATPTTKSGDAENGKYRFATLPCMRSGSFTRLTSIFKMKKPSRAISRRERKSRRSCCLKQSALCRKKKGKLSCCTISRA